MGVINMVSLAATVNGTAGCTWRDDEPTRYAVGDVWWTTERVELHRFARFTIFTIHVVEAKGAGSKASALTQALVTRLKAQQAVWLDNKILNQEVVRADDITGPWTVRQIHVVPQFWGMGR